MSKHKKTFYVHFMEFLRRFVSVTTIHGLNRTFQEGRYFDTIFWIILLIVAIYGSFLISYETFQRYRKNPTVIFMERDHLFWNTSFPAGTICPKYRTDPEKVKKYVFKNAVKNATYFQNFITSLAHSSYDNFGNVLPYEDLPSEKYLETLIELMFDFKPVVSNSATSGQFNQLQQTVTEIGICYSYNSQLAYHNSLSHWKSGKWKISNGNQILFVHPLDGEVFVNIVNMSTSYDLFWQLFIHGPYETVDIASRRIYQENERLVQVYLSGLTIFSSEKVRDLTPEQRKCRFYDESNLDHFPLYSHVQCRMECRIILAKRLCGCIPHFYIRKIGNEKVCDVQGLHCLAKHSGILTTLKKECSCSSNCDEVNYVIEEMTSVEWFLGTNILWGFKKYPAMRLRRDVLFGFTDFLVYIGGITGLFFGCSFLSFIEIFYFFTIRLFWSVIVELKRRIK